MPASAWFAVWFLAAFQFLVVAYIAVTRAQTLMAEGNLSLFWKAWLVVPAIVGFLLDVAFNLTVGSVLYLEWPKEWVFSHRCRRHLSSSGFRGAIARWFQRQLNQISEGHV